MSRTEKLRELMKRAHKTDSDLEAEGQDQEKPENEDKEELKNNVGEAHVEGSDKSDPGEGGGVDDAVREQDKADTQQSEERSTPDESKGHVTDKELKSAKEKKASLNENLENISSKLNAFLKEASEDEEDKGEKQPKPKPDREVEDPEAEKDPDAETPPKKKEKKDEDEDSDESEDKEAEELSVKAGEEAASIIGNAMVQEKRAKEQRNINAQIKESAETGYTDAYTAARALDNAVGVITSSDEAASYFEVKSAMEDMESSLRKQGLEGVLDQAPPVEGGDPMAMAGMPGDVGMGGPADEEAIVAIQEMEQLMKALLDGKQPETEEEQEIYDMLVHLGLLGGGSEAPAEESIEGSPGPEETTLEEEVAEEDAGDPLSKLSKKQAGLLLQMAEAMSNSNKSRD